MMGVFDTECLCANEKGYCEKNKDEQLAGRCA